MYNLLGIFLGIKDTDGIVRGRQFSKHGRPIRSLG